MCEKYSKDSFDRFGDDLCEVLLSYLSFDHKFSYECVCRQWHRLVYNRHHELIIDMNLCHKLSPNDDNCVFIERFEAIVRKCVNITDVSVDSIHKFSINAVFECIVKYCLQLNAINMKSIRDLSADHLNEFFAKFGPKLKSISFTKTANTLYNKTIVRNARVCVNLHDLDISGHQRNNPFQQLFSDRNHVMSAKLKRISFKYSMKEAKGFDLLVQKYGQSLKALDVTVSRSCDDKAFKTLMNGLSQMKALIDLQIINDSKCFLNANQLKQIGVNCRRLKRLSLNIIEFSAQELLAIIVTINTHFRRIKRLEIRGYFPEDFTLTSESLNGCKGLTHLTIISYYGYKFQEMLFGGIARHLPRLQWLHIENTNITDIALNELSKLENLQNVRLFGGQHYTPSVHKNLITGCDKLIDFSINIRK